MSIENPQNFEWDSPESFYCLTFYLVNGIKVPNNWRKFTHMFLSKKDLRLSNMNLVDTVMKQINVKGAKVKQILNEMEWVDFDRMYFMYHILGIDRFNKIENKYFDETFSNSYPIPMEDRKMGRLNISGPLPTTANPKNNEAKINFAIFLFYILRNCF